MNKHDCFFCLMIGVILGVCTGYILASLQHQNLHAEAQLEMSRLELEMLELDQAQSEILVLEYFVDKANEDLRRLGWAIQRLIYEGPKGRINLDGSLFQKEESND